jgi:3-hydroxypropanoate dehydrogenase
MDGTDLRYFVERLRLTTPEPRLPAHERRRLFLEPRCHGAWLPQDVPDTLIEEAWALARMGPTSANGSPLRLVLLRGAAEKARLLPLLDKSNREKSRLAPVVAILAHDVKFWRRLDRLHPHVDAATWFKDDPALARETAFRNGTLQAAYFILAVRALGADVGAVSGFDAPAVQAAFLAGTALEVNFVCNIGYGDPAELKPRLPRLALEEIVHRPAAGA